MSEKAIIWSSDILRWVISLTIHSIIVCFVFLLFKYPFAWLIGKTSVLGIFPHFIFWIFAGILIAKLTTTFSVIISVLTVFLVRQSTTHVILLGVSLIAIVGSCIYGAWFDPVDLSWKTLRYSTFNKILFTFLILNLLKIPIQIYSFSKK